MIPGMDSYRGRYAYLSLLVAGLVLTVAYFGWSHVKGSSHSQIEQISLRSQTAELVIGVESQINRLENQLLRVLLEPDFNDTEAINHALSKLSDQLTVLTQKELSLEIIQQHEASGILADLAQLKRDVSRLLEIRLEAQEWSPTLLLLRDEMQPADHSLRQLIGEMEQFSEFSEDKEAVESLLSLKRAWQDLVDQMHHYLVFRMGTLIDGSDVQMPDFKQNIAIAAPQVLTQLNALQDRNEASPSWDKDQIERLRGDVNQWIKASRMVVTALESEVWRKDLQLLSDSITPLLSRMREYCSGIDLRLDNDSATELTQLSQIARQLSDLILGGAVIGILMILAAYLYINRTLLKPIAETAFALKEEARGTIDIKPPPAELREMQDLVDAFDEMRRQVRQRQRYLDHVAHHDALTQLPNRTLFRDRLEHALAISLRGETQVGLMFLDLDQFKQVNDSLGHLVGDELLQTVAERLTELVRSSDTVARLGGDEFAILVEGINSRDDMSLLANKILRTIEKPMTLADRELHISVSVGIATAPHDDVSADFLIRDADIAMYEAKRQGRAAYCFFSDEMTTKATESLQREAQVRLAAERNEFVFHFQPIIDCKHGQLFCFEALMRWRHPERGIVHPAEFLNTLDDTGIIASVVDSLMWQAYSFQHDRYLQTGEKVAIAINLSVRLLNDRVFRKQLLERLVAHDFFKKSLILEITEEILMQDLADADIFLQQTKALGARIALDDFGTGQASLSHLRQFPFDYLKIDRDFIRNVESDKNDANVVQAMVELGHAFGIQVIAEGVENEAQLSFLQELGCDYAQGYLIGVPSHAEHQFEMSGLRPLFVN